MLASHLPRISRGGILGKTLNPNPGTAEEFSELTWDNIERALSDYQRLQNVKRYNYVKIKGAEVQTTKNAKRKYENRENFGQFSGLTGGNRGRLCATIKVCKWEGWSLSNIIDLQYFEPVKLDFNESRWCWLRVGSKIGLILPTPTHPPTFIMTREWELSKWVCIGFGI